MRVLITGTSRGLGQAVARHLVAQGHSVIGCSRTECDIHDPCYEHFAADVTEERAVEALFKHVRSQYDGLDAVINNAGWGRMLPLALTPVATARRIVDTNFLSTFLITKSAVRLLKRSGEGRVVNVSSVAVPLSLEGEAVYAAAKSAVETFTRVSARELAPFSITCNAVAPSPIRTRLLEGVPEDKLQSLIARQAIPKWAEVADVVNVVDFFLRPESRMITGQIIYLGGQS